MHAATSTCSLVLRHCLYVLHSTCCMLTSGASAYACLHLQDSDAAVAVAAAWQAAVPSLIGADGPLLTQVCLQHNQITSLCAGISATVASQSHTSNSGTGDQMLQQCTRNCLCCSILPQRPLLHITVTLHLSQSLLSLLLLN
jgi:hypothetical protein